MDQFPRVLPEIVDFVVNIWVWVATYIQRGFAEWECKKSYFCLAIEMISGYNLIRLFQAFYIQTGGVKCRCIVLVSVKYIAALNLYPFQPVYSGKIKKNDFGYTQMWAPSVVYMDKCKERFIEE